MRREGNQSELNKIAEKFDNWLTQTALLGTALVEKLAACPNNSSLLIGT
jgi:hypothetical protein